MLRSLAHVSHAAVVLVIFSIAARVVGAQAVVVDAPNFVAVSRHDAERRVDVTVGGQPFTAYIWPTSLMKPTLYPLRSASGAVVTRGYPLEARGGERVDHPHHAGLWFNYGNVNGLDFWNNSTAIKAADTPKMGTIVHREVTRVASGQGEGALEVRTDWVNHAGSALLQENTRFVFRATLHSRTIERVTTLTALDDRVTFTDDKEGLIGMRVARALEHPSTTPEKFTDASGRPTAVAVLDNSGVTGRYRSSEGKEGDDVWGTRARWVTLSGVVSGQQVTIAMLDHPTNPGFPTHWHARGYGLFAANPLGQKIFSQGKEALNFSIAAGTSRTFRYSVIIFDGAPTTSEVEQAYTLFAR